MSKNKKEEIQEEAIDDTKTASPKSSDFDATVRTNNTRPLRIEKEGTFTAILKLDEEQQQCEVKMESYHHTQFKMESKGERQDGEYLVYCVNKSGLAQYLLPESIVAVLSFT